ncbi:3892_t:CDS:2, partial [Gigaspora rosea]
HQKLMFEKYLDLREQLVSENKLFTLFERSLNDMNFWYKARSLHPNRFLYNDDKWQNFITDPYIVREKYEDEKLHYVKSTNRLLDAFACISEVKFVLNHVKNLNANLKRKTKMGWME